MKKLFTILYCLSAVISLHSAAQIRVACVGNSVTAGYGLANPQVESWPGQLATMLGTNYSVLNCGVSGTTMLKRGGSPYWNTGAFTTAKNFDPQILIISLGTNDAHPGNWVYKDDFYNDYAAMIDAFRQNGRNPAIYVCFPLACYGDANQINNLQTSLIPIISQISIAKNVTVIDFNTPTQNQRNTLYNDNLHPNVAGAAVLANTAFNVITPAIPTFYHDCNYSGYAVKLGIGDYNLAALQAKGITNNDISAIKIPSGYKATVYSEDNFAGNAYTITGNDDCLVDNGWNDNISSLRVRANGVTGKNGTYTLQNRNSGKYMDVAGGNAADGTNILQWNATNATNQQFTFTDVGDGAYKLINVQTGKAVDVEYGSTNNVGNVLQWTYNNNLNQHFILIASDNNYYKLKAAHSGRIIEVYGGGINAGDDVDQFDDNNQLHGQWRLNAILSKTQSAENQETIIYPNPSTDQITLTNIPPRELIMIFDLSGKCVMNMRAPTTKGTVSINVSKLKPGSYIIKTGHKTGLKLIKQ
ncbi:Por secretion system C-terminal sorting domain-containing protein [Chitinophaga sp. YR627]|uniref:RICIN domain-containing protein n=1 Tax=Chitinophaga sp. YR627 TaxID=1881041 RepID=UPI0008F2B3A3|nr:RICIN domain-containing protein [Chitinophaga sp. YR627]SFN23196.1 Por secretion system C-terminal sorting domain-containing protein [Chitinophaga sp. YR627]